MEVCRGRVKKICTNYYVVVYLQKDNTMSAAEYNMPTHISGDTFEGVQFDVTINGVAANLTGAEIILSFTRNTSKLTSPKHIEISATPGRFVVRRQVLVLPIGTHEYRIKIRFADGTSKTYIKGQWRIDG